MRQALQINWNAEGDDVRPSCGKELQLEGGCKAKVEADQATNLPQVLPRAQSSHQHRSGCVGPGGRGRDSVVGREVLLGRGMVKLSAELQTTFRIVPVTMTALVGA